MLPSYKAATGKTAMQACGVANPRWVVHASGLEETVRPNPAKPGDDGIAVPHTSIRFPEPFSE
ncbi:MAG: hypothetical protein R6U50_16825 [Desulfobacterales bacterium]